MCMINKHAIINCYLCAGQSTEARTAGRRSEIAGEEEVAQDQARAASAGRSASMHIGGRSSRAGASAKKAPATDRGITLQPQTT